MRDDALFLGPGYVNLIQLFDAKAKVTSVSYWSKHDIETAFLEEVLATVHHNLLFPSDYSAESMQNLGEDIGELLSEHYNGCVVTFACESDLDHLLSVSHKYGIPEPEELVEF